MHSHHHDHPRTGSVLRWSVLVTVVFVVIEFMAGLHARSLALLADAGHNLTDASALLLAWFGFYMQSRPATETKTFGFHRAGVLAAFINAGTLIILALYIFYESYVRLLNPRPVDEVVMLVIAGVGLVINVAIMMGLKHDTADLNIRAAYLHMFGDALGSIGIIIGAIVIRYTDWLIIDPILSFLIGGLIVWTAWDVVKESLNILLEGTPRGVTLRQVSEAMRQVSGVVDVHDLHIWSLGSHAHALSCHVLIDDMPTSESEGILHNINCVLADRFEIHHTTVQFEHARCALSERGCNIPAHSHHGHRHGPGEGN